ncbi:hypothetical protein RFI_13339 [Reticulomyxa filosa]|uniref:Uncharacterized protein n=1 Tax=Reticulomyxa filosa TaxID=46433 RepID=X6NC13_RETFI|nr:hypothetical protein RFI_13339 [Reticulomyxa filosa]|eukprot:ETO23830.1 hypothetical protein RFI_13339 [Reticulomyxa filosa]
MLPRIVFDLLCTVFLTKQLFLSNSKKKGGINHKKSDKKKSSNKIEKIWDYFEEKKNVPTPSPLSVTTNNIFAEVWSTTKKKKFYLFYLDDYLKCCFVCSIFKQEKKRKNPFPALKLRNEFHVFFVTVLSRLGFDISQQGVLANDDDYKVPSGVAKELHRPVLLMQDDDNNKPNEHCHGQYCERSKQMIDAI